MLAPLLYLVAGAVLYAYLLRRTSVAALAEMFARADVLPLLAASGLGFVTTALRAARFASLAPVATGPVELYGLFAVMRLLRFAMPFQSGEVLALMLLKRRGLTPSVARIAPVWMLLMIGDLAAAGLLLSLALGAVALDGPVRWAGGLLLAAGVGPPLFSCPADAGRRPSRRGFRPAAAGCAAASSSSPSAWRRSATGARCCAP